MNLNIIISKSKRCLQSDNSNMPSGSYRFILHKQYWVYSSRKKILHSKNSQNNLHRNIQRGISEIHILAKYIICLEQSVLC